MTTNPNPNPDPSPNPNPSPSPDPNQAQGMLGQMNFNGQGGKEDFAEARRQSLTLPRTLTQA